MFFGVCYCWKVNISLHQINLPISSQKTFSDVKLRCISQ